MAKAELAIAWFPARDFELALELWPEFIEWPVSDHPDYCEHIEGELRKFGADATMAVAPIRLEDYLPWCEAETRDPSTPETRARYAAILASERRVVPWPPEQDAACWCGSAQKYKWCCGRNRI